MEGDPANLAPVIGDLNQARSALAYGLAVSGREYERCDFRVTQTDVQPPAARRGDLARMSLSFLQRYPHQVEAPPGYAALLARWSAEDPIDDFEALHAQRLRQYFQ